MKTITLNGKIKLVICLLFITYLGHSQSITYTSSDVFVPPSGLTTVTVEAWGAGGKGGTRSNTYVTGGGGGGAYAKKVNVTLNPTSNTITVGIGSSANNTPGGDSWFGSTATVLAKGGSSVAQNTTSGASGGLASLSVGDLGFVFSGGNGATGTPNTTSGNAGGGGSSAGTAGGGNNGSSFNGGGAPAGGGAGGNGASNSNSGGADGIFPGGGGGGALRRSGSTKNGGNGADGQIIITYTCPTYALTSAASNNGPFCGSSAAIVTLRSTSMLPGTYTVTYNLSGATNAGGMTATLTFVSGTPNYGTFTTTNLNVGTTNITVTDISASGTVTCSNAIAANNTTSVTIAAPPTANAGSAVNTCVTSTSVVVSSGATATNYSAVAWTTSGTGTFNNPNVLTGVVYTPSAADKTAGSVILTLTVTGNAPCGTVSSNKTVNINRLPIANAGNPIVTCPTAPPVNVTDGATTTYASAVLWSSSGTGTFTSANSLTLATYTPSAADKLAGSVTLTLTAYGLTPCGTTTATKTLTFNPNPTAVAGTIITTCSSDGAVNITTGSSATNHTSVLWSSNGTGTFTDADSLTLATYTPSAADITAGSVTLTLNALSANCSNGTSTKTLTIVATPIANAGPNVNTCYNSGTILISGGSSASNYTSVVWTSSGTGTFIDDNSLTIAAYTPSAADIAAGSVTLTLTAVANEPCASNTAATKTLFINESPTGDAGTALTTCNTSSPINVTAGATADHYTSLLWTSSGTGTFTNANSLTLATYTPSAADVLAGGVILTLTVTSAGCGSDTSTKTLTIYTTPSITSTTPGTRTGAGTVILGASASTGTLYWYAAPTGGTSLGFGSSFTTPVIAATTTYYVEALNGTCPSAPRTAVIATVIYPEIDIRGNATSIADGDTTPSTTDWTDFGSTNMSRTFTIYNTGVGGLTLGAITISGANAGDFAITVVPNSTVASSATTTFTVTFNPTAAGTRTATITIPNNDSNENPYDFAIQGTGVAREIDIQGNATTIADGDTTPATTDWTDFSSVTSTRTYTIRNLGNIILTLGAITIDGVNASDFVVTTPPATSTLGAYATTTFTVTFTPGAILDRYAAIHIVNNDSDENPYDYSLHGYGVIPEIDIRGNGTSIVENDITPSTTDWTDFGNATVTRTFTIHNLGNTTLTIGAITFAGTNPTEFSVTTPPSATVAAFSTTTFTVTFAPSTTGTRSAQIRIVNNDSTENPYRFNIQGTGVAQEIDIQGNATTISDGDTTPAAGDWTDFSNVALTRTFTIRNTGNLPLTLGAISFSGTNPGDFTVTTAPVSPVPAFGNTTFTVTFTQGGIGTRSAIFSVVNNDSGENPYDFTIQATGGVPEINIKSQFGVNIADGDTTPASTDQTNFGEVSMDGGTVTVNFIMENTGTGAMSVGAATFTGTNASNFTLTMPPSATIAAGSFSRFQISFSPTTIGAKSAVFSIVNNDSDENSYNFDLSGMGVQTYKDTDADGVTDNKDLDDDNDGIIDTKEQTDGITYPLTSLVEYVFLNETFGAGTTKGLININTPGATCTYCYEDRYGSACDANVTLEDGEYCVNYKITGSVASDPENIHGDLAWYDGLDHTTGDTDGRMAIFNASFAPGTFYETRIDGVIPNVLVSYSFYVLNIMRKYNYSGSILPNITVEFVDLSNNLLSSFTTGNIGRCVAGDTTNNDCDMANWLQFSTSVNLGNVTSFIVRFKNNSTGGGGNDLAIDDIKITQNYIDTDGDGIANIFDLDDENDGISDVEEAGFKQYSNGLSKMDLSSGATWVDANVNGLNDVVDAQISGGTYLIADTDADGVPNYLDLDSDNDSLFDVDESGLYNGDGDINGDGKGDLADTDRDGILDLYDNNTGFGTTPRTFAQDTDANTIADYLQLDANSDGVNDIQTGLYASLDANNDGQIDGAADIDKDGILDTFDTNTSVIGSPRDLNRKLFLDFDGRNDYGQGTTLLGGRSTVSMMAWIDLASGYNANGVILGQDNFFLRINNARQLEVVMNGSALTYSTPLSTNQWYHVGATLTAGFLKLYLNGNMVLTDNIGSGISGDTNPLTIGRMSGSSSQFFKGKIDEVRLFSVALTDAQFQKIVYQEIQNVGAQVRGAIIPKNVPGALWSSVLRYYRMDAYKDDIIDDLTTASIDAGTGMKIFNNKYIKVQEAPMPFVTERIGNFATAANSPVKEIRGMDIMDQDWSIVQVKHNITETANNVDLGMFIDPGVTVVADNDIKIQNDWYLLLDGKIDLQGKSQLVQTTDSDLAPSSGGSLERDQQGQANIYNYNYWCAPVGAISSTTNNNSYTVNGIMRDGTNPNAIQNINFVAGYNGAPTSPISISSYWIFKFQNTSPIYANWSSVGPNGILLAGEGFTMKGSGAATPTQNFTFLGKPHNGTITSPIAANNLNLSGNPYASALDSDQFLLNNLSVTTGAVYFWEHYNTNNTHVLTNYQGGYATRNLTGGTPPVAPAGISGAGISTRIPGRFIPVGQGFFVNGSATGGNITFNNSQRLFVKEDNVASNFMFRQVIQNGPRNTSPAYNNQEDGFEPDTFARVRVGFTSPENFHRQVLLGFMEEHATSGIDAGYDAPHIDNQPSDMYFMNGETKLNIEGDGHFNIGNIYPIGVKVAAAGTVKFTLDGTQNFEDGQEIYIYDNATATYHSIREESFNIELPAGTVDNRFSVRFKTDSELHTDDFDANGALSAIYTSDDSMITITNRALDVTAETVMLFNMLGQSITSWDVSNAPQSKIQLPVQTLSTGTYIVKVLTSKGELSKKVIIK